MYAFVSDLPQLYISGCTVVLEGLCQNLVSINSLKNGVNLTVCPPGHATSLLTGHTINMVPTSNWARKAVFRV